MVAVSHPFLSNHWEPRQLKSYYLGSKGVTGEVGDSSSEGVDLSDPTPCYMVAVFMLVAFHLHVQHHCASHGLPFLYHGWANVV